VPGPLGDLGGRDTSIEPCRDASVSEVVDAPSQRGSVFAGSQGGTPCLAPRASVGD
jgi:hypothetical protein